MAGMVNEEVKRFLRGRDFAVLCVVLDLGGGPEAVVVVKSTADLLAGLRLAQAPVEMGWALERTPHGPVLCLVVRCAGDGVGELAGEAYFDPADQEDLSLLERLAGQERVRAAFLDEELQPVWLAEEEWDEVRRLETEQVRDRLEELRERCRQYDFEAAKRAFQDELPLARLLDRVFRGSRP
ncbi:MAG: hypothetical protein SCH98_01650 [Deferrisomatales bacterium]|nr:hypothetical protein [Deferrisomatales bacterium]